MPDLSTSFDDAWSRFQTLDALHIDGDTRDQDWSRGRAQYLAFILRIEDVAAREHIARASERLREIPGVDLYPDWYWHVTVKGAGFQVIRRSHDDDILREDVSRIARDAARVLSREAAFDVQLGLANAFPSVVIAEVLDGSRTRDLNVALTQGLPQLAPSPGDGDAFLPHISIARFTSNDGLPALKQTLAALRAEGPGPSFPIRRVEFIKAWLTEDVPEFDTLATYQLAAAGTRARP